MSNFEKIANVLVDTKEIEKEKITKEATWADLELDSLDAVEVVMNLEDEFGIELEMSEEIKTVGDLLALVESKLGE